MPEPQKKVGWVPLFGDFEVASAQDITFKGKMVPVTPPDASPDTEPKMQPHFGILMSNMTVADGDVSAEIEFESIIPATMCELAVAYDPNASHVLTAGLGGEEWAMFGIREFGGPKNQKGWWPYRVSGNRGSLKPHVKYHVEARFRGAIVTLLIDGVLVASVEVSSPVGKDRQVGMMCRNDHDIKITNLTVSRSKPKAFVVMQFGAEYDDLYTDVVKEVFKHYEGNIQRGDEVSGPGIVLTDIVREINEAQLVIADITPANPNVYFEVGPRWTPENRPVVDGAKPASGGAVPSVSVVPRPRRSGKRVVAAVCACPRGYPDMAAMPRGASEGQSAMRQCGGEGRDPVQGAFRSLCRRVRQLRGPQVRTWAWWSSGRASP